MKSRASSWGLGHAVAAAIALLAGFALAWVDTRPAWDDTGVSALMVAIIAAGAAAWGVRAGLAATAAAGPLIVAGLLVGNAAALIALLPAVLGAIAGTNVHRVIGRLRGGHAAPP